MKSLPIKIETIDTELAEVHRIMAQPEFYKQPSSEITNKQARLNELERRLAAAYPPQRSLR